MGVHQGKRASEKYSMMMPTKALWGTGTQGEQAAPRSPRQDTGIYSGLSFRTPSWPELCPSHGQRFKNFRGWDRLRGRSFPSDPGWAAPSLGLSFPNC